MSASFVSKKDNGFDSLLESHVGPGSPLRTLLCVFKVPKSSFADLWRGIFPLTLLAPLSGEVQNVNLPTAGQ